MKVPRWIPERLVLAIHEDQLAQHGGSLGIRDRNLLGASLARPQHLLAYSNPHIFDLAAAYGYALVKNHSFVDGNKRTAFMVMYTFLGLNNYWLDVLELEVVSMIEGLSTDKETQASIVRWLENNTAK